MEGYSSQIRSEKRREEKRREKAGAMAELVRLLHDPEAEAEDGKAEKAAASGKRQCCDVIVVGTGLTESIAAAALAKRGLKVLHLEPNETYGGECWTTQKLSDVVSALRNAAASDGNEAGEKEVNASDQKGIRVTYPSNQNFADVSVASSSSGAETLGEETGVEFGAGGLEGVQLDLACTPKLCLGAGDLIETLVCSDAHRYLEFKAVQSTFLWTSEKGEEAGDKDFILVPASRSDIFKSKDLSLVEKRLMMRYLKSEQDTVAAAGAAGDGSLRSSNEREGEANVSMLNYLKNTHKLPKKIRSIVLYGIADLEDDDCDSSDETFGNTQSTSAAAGRSKLYKYAKSIDRFGLGVGALLACNYGNGELAQAFCRLAAVHGATYVLKFAPNEVCILDESPQSLGGKGEDYRYQVIIPGAESVWCKKLVFGPVASLSDKSNILEMPGRNPSKVSRCCCIAKAEPALKGGSINLYVFPPSFGGGSTIRALRVHGNALNTCKDDSLVIVNLSCCSSSLRTPKEDLEAALSKLVDLTGIQAESSGDNSASTSLPKAVLCLYYTQNLDAPAFSKDFVKLGGPDASLSFQSAVEDSARCVRHLYPEFEALFENEEGSSFNEDSEDEADANHLQDIINKIT